MKLVVWIVTGLQDVYTWGDNSNFTLGHGNEQRKKYPEMIESFRKKGVSIKQVDLKLNCLRKN